MSVIKVKKLIKELSKHYFVSGSDLALAFETVLNEYCRKEKYSITANLLKENKAFALRQLQFWAGKNFPKK